MTLQQLVDCCRLYPDLLTIPFDILTRHITLLRHLKTRIAFTQPSTNLFPPSGLPLPIHNFLCLSLGLDDRTAILCWTALKDIAWNYEGAGEQGHIAEVIPLFLEHGLQCGLSVYEFSPPFRRCLQPHCPNNPRERISGDAPDLGEAVRIQASVFTKTFGALPASAISMYCRGCSTRYHHNYFVQDNIRVYYPENVSAQSYIQVAPHFFLESALCERFATQMAMAWTSSQNCARIYNEEAALYSWTSMLPVDWPYTFDLHYELVGEAFTIHCLIGWHRERGTILQVSHKARDQPARWNEAINERNLAMAGTGQPAWNHACKLCTKHVKNKDGDIIGAYRSVVTDGISLGHPCCAVHDCKEMLASTRHRVCVKHGSVANKCAVVACHAQAEASFRTCVIPTHRSAEARFLDQGKGMAQLKARLARMESALAEANRPAVEESDEGSEEEEVLMDREGRVFEPCDDKPSGGLRKVFARFGRRRTNNEELCVGSCGVILGRATFYGAEGPNSVRVFWKTLFPTKESLPAVLWYDNNCHVAAMLQKDNDTYFSDVALPVDVFHFKAKHKESHKFCGQNCNPAMWPDLIDESTGKWVFNSSAAEQVNRWFGGFKAITRLMRQDRYNFFLDEMIIRRNRFLIRSLEEKGCAPYLIPREELLHENSIQLCT